MTKISNQYSLTNVLFADAVNGRVGIGTASPTVPLDVVGAGRFSTQVNIATSSSGYTTPSLLVNAGPSTSIPLQAIADSTGGRLFRFYTSDFNNTTTGTSIRLNFGAPTGNTSANLQVYTGGEQVVAGSILSLQPSGGNVGIGTTSPTSYSPTTFQVNGSGASASIKLTNTTTGAGAANGLDILQSTTDTYIYNRTTGIMVFGTSDTERMRITSGGDVYVGATTFPGAGFATTGVAFGQSGFISSQRNAATVGYFGRGTNDGELFAFFRGTTQVGNISVTTSATSYNTNSDYRLKEDFKPINGLEKISAIKVYDFKWKGEEYRMDGVLAHELAEVLPYAVHGKKDGKEMQSVDYSKIVPVLISSIQEQQTQINELKALLNA